MLIGSHRWRIDPCRFRWPWVILKGGTRGVYLITLVHLSRTTNFGRITHVGRISRVSHALIPRGRAPSTPQFCDSFILMRTPFVASTKFDVVRLLFRGQLRPVPKGRREQRFSILGVLYLWQHSLKNDQIGRGNTYSEGVLRSQSLHLHTCVVR